uniref:DUF3152 domain-containing protein n=1 Tax=viral metagenome TaxID=1070528 RepID=A0A6C0LJK5_9ZZZZ
MPKVKYYISKTDDINDQEYNEYSKIIKEILTHRSGWIKSPYNYEFVYDETKEDGDIMPPIKVEFYTNENLVNKIGNSLNKLSAYDPTKLPNKHGIYFNLDNWDGGPHKTKSGVEQPFPDDMGPPLDTYRYYVVNHEFGHALGLDHPNLSKDIVSVMYQGTKGLEWLRIKNPNRNYVWFPGPDEETGNHLNYKKAKGGGVQKNCMNRLTMIIMLVLCAIFIIFLFAKHIKSFFSSQSPQKKRLYNDRYNRKSYNLDIYR